MLGSARLLHGVTTTTPALSAHQPISVDVLDHTAFDFDNGNALIGNEDDRVGLHVPMTVIGESKPSQDNCIVAELLSQCAGD